MPISIGFFSWERINQFPIISYGKNSFGIRPVWYKSKDLERIKDVYWRTTVLPKYLPQCRFVRHKPDTTWPRIESGPRPTAWVMARPHQAIVSLHAIHYCCFLIGMGGGGIESNLVHLALQPPIGLLCQFRVIMMMEKFVEWWLARKTKYSEKTCPSAAFSTTCLPGREPGQPQWEASY
jgi:hypothetical protein